MTWSFDDAESGHGKHWMKPRDAGAMVRLTDAMLDHMSRPVDWVHMPVPIERARHVASFGVATECGIGRIPRDEVVPTLEIHRDVLLPERA